MKREPKASPKVLLVQSEAILRLLVGPVLGTRVLQAKERSDGILSSKPLEVGLSHRQGYSARVE